jgi:hypothetical protein
MLKSTFLDDENGGSKMDKKRSKMTPYKIVKN